MTITTSNIICNLLVNLPTRQLVNSKRKANDNRPYLDISHRVVHYPFCTHAVRAPAHSLNSGNDICGSAHWPHGFGVLERDGSFELFGKVGLYYIMFLASLEMNLQDVQRIKGRALTLGLLSFAIPMLIGYVANTFLLGYGIAASILIAAMYASHTLIAYPIVLRYGLSRLKSVSIAVGEQSWPIRLLY